MKALKRKIGELVDLSLALDHAKLETYIKVCPDACLCMLISDNTEISICSEFDEMDPLFSVIIKVGNEVRSVIVDGLEMLTSFLQILSKMK